MILYPNKTNNKIIMEYTKDMIDGTIILYNMMMFKR